MKKLLLLMLNLLTTQLFISCGNNTPGGVLQLKPLDSQTATREHLDVPDNTFIDVHATIPQTLSVLFKPAEQIPTVTAKRYLRVQESYDSTISQLNGRSLGEKGAVIYSISGKKIILDEMDANNILKLLQNRFDIKKVILSAQEIEINSKLYLPGTTVELHAQKLIIGKDALLDLSALDAELEAKQFADGLDGSAGGDLLLFSPHVIIEKREGPFFISYGANGQKGGAGRNGIAGRSVPVVQGRTITFVYSQHRECNRETGHPICYTQENSLGSRELPTDGTDAMAGGVPGIGGNGGSLFSAQYIADNLVDMGCGKSAHAQMYYGGDAGQPTTATQIINGRSTSFSVHAGANAIAQEKQQQCFVGEQVINEKFKRWMTADSALAITNYAEDLYKLNHFSQAKKLFSAVEQTKFTSTSVVSTLAKSRTNHALYNIRSGLDFYGHDVHWSPVFSLQANLSQWVQNKNYYLKLLQFSNSLKIASRDNMQQISTVEILAKTSAEQIEKLKQSHHEIIQQLPEVKEELQTVDLQEQTIRQELIRLERQIRQQAEDELRPSSWSKALHALGAVVSVIPAGQPGFSAVGTGLTTFANLLDSDQPVQDMFHQFPRLSKMFSADRLEQAARDWNDKWSQVKPSNISNLSTTREQVNYVKDVMEFSSPMIDEFNRQISFLQQREVPQGQLEQTMVKIAAQHPDFNSLIDQLRSLLEQKKKIVKKIRAWEASLLKIGNDLHTALVNYVEAKQSYTRLMQGLSLEDKNWSVRLEREAQAGLAYGIYLLEHSFANMFVAPLDLHGEFKKLMNSLLVKLQHQQAGSLDQIEALSVLYDYELQEIKRKILEQFYEHLPRERTFKFPLTVGELQQLNHQHSVLISTFDPRFKVEQFENVRLVSIQVARVTGSFQEQDEVIIERVGDFYLSRAGETYAFSGPSHDEIASFYYNSDEQYFVESIIDGQVDVLLSSILGLNPAEKNLIFERPGALAIYRISFKGNISSRLRSMQLLLNCSIWRK